MRCGWQFLIAIVLFTDINLTYANLQLPQLPVNFTALRIEAVKKFQLRGCQL